MAAALIPLAISMAPEIIAFITGLVHHKAPIAEANNGPSTGPLKFAQVLQAVKDGIAQAEAAGQLIGPTPTDEALKVVIQTIITSLKLQGLLQDSSPIVNVTAAAPAPLKSYSPTQTVTLKPGDSISILVPA